MVNKQIKECPPSTENESYGWSVGNMAQRVLKDLNGY